MALRLFLVEAPSEFADAMAEMTTEERPQGDTFGISHLSCDFFNALIACLQEMYGVFHAQILKIGEWGFAHDRFHSASQGSFACAGSFCRFIERKTFGEST